MLPNLGRPTFIWHFGRESPGLRCILNLVLGVGHNEQRTLEYIRVLGRVPIIAYMGGMARGRLRKLIIFLPC
jgi:hypothetical protein